MARYQKTSKQAYRLQRKWKPIPYGLCPKCESEAEKKASPTPSGPRKPPEKPPPVVER